MLVNGEQEKANAMDRIFCSGVNFVALVFVAVSFFRYFEVSWKLGTVAVVFCLLYSLVYAGWSLLAEVDMYRSL